MNVVTILLVVLGVMIIVYMIQRSNKLNQKPFHNSEDLLSSWPNRSPTYYRDHPWGTTKFEPGDLTRLEKELRSASREEEKE